MNVPAERPARPPARTLYELRIAGPVPADLVRDLPGIDVTVEPAETILYGPLQDQAALFGLLVRIHDLGLQLLEVRPVTHEDPVPPL
jgi:hypothetical protein